MLRLYSYLYHLGLGLFLLGLAFVALLSSNTLKIPILPWTGTSLTQWLLWGGILGIVSVVLAVTGVFRYLFPLWALAVLGVMIRGYVLTPVPFDGRSDAMQALWLTLGALLAFLASLTLLTLRRTRRA
ncbi:MAG TPA: hypothetical protein VES20_20585 [Bryobacteraceae bacterium]|nr:hypothetical protein [Bryobacteraceae bacterium]